MTLPYALATALILTAAFVARWRRPAASRHFLLATAFVTVLLLPGSRFLAPVAEPVRTVLAGTVVDADVLARDTSFPFQTLWLGGVAVAFAVMLTGALLVRTRLQPAPAGCARMAADLACQLGIGRRVRVFMSRNRMPYTYGILRPVIVLPKAAEAWDTGRLRIVLAHELLHVRRLDAATDLLAGIATALHWFNPFAWYGAGVMRRDRELACDDAMLVHGTDGAEYATHLLGVASEYAHVPGAVPIARVSHLEARIRAMLNPNLTHIGGPSMKAKLAAGMAAAIILLAGSGWHAAAQSGAQSRPIRTSGERQSAKIVKMVRPTYPKHLKEAGLEGRVLLEVVISREGKVTRIEASPDNQAHQDFVQASIDAVKLWEYEPTLLNGEPVDVITTVEVNFTLSK